jgi:hypothetical protein
MISAGGGRSALGKIALGLWALAAVLALYFGYRFLFPVPARNEHEVFPSVGTTAVIEAPNGHAYQYVQAPNLSWEAARTAAAQLKFRDHAGYLATIDDEAEYLFIVKTVFPGPPPDVTYLGGRQAAPGEWRWVTGPDAAEDGGKGKLFWLGDEKGAAQASQYVNWEYTAFQHGGKWDVSKVCCVTIFSYGFPQFSTSLGDGDREEGVSGYLVEFGG